MGRHGLQRRLGFWPKTLPTHLYLEQLCSQRFDILLGENTTQIFIQIIALRRGCCSHPLQPPQSDKDILRYLPAGLSHTRRTDSSINSRFMVKACHEMLKLFDPVAKICRARAIPHHSLEERCPSTQEVGDGHECPRMREMPGRVSTQQKPE